MDNTWYIRDARIIDPACNRDEVADFYIENGIISDPSSASCESISIIEGKGMTLVPGLIDLHVHFREPGNEASETIESGSNAAAKGGFTTVVTMPNTTPPIDNPDALSKAIQTGQRCGKVNLLPSGCITADRNGEKMADLEAMAAAGAVAFTDDGHTTELESVMRKAMTVAEKLNIPIMDHALDHNIAGNGAMREGKTCSMLGLPGIPAEAEISVVKRDINLSRETGCAVHIQHISTAGACELIRDARKEGLRVTGEASPHHLSFIDSDIKNADTNFKMNPPLGTAADRKALIEAVIDGTISTLATDHAPHTAESKSRNFVDAPSGVVGLETALAATYTILVKEGKMSLMEWVRRWTAGPAIVLGIDPPALTEGKRADIVILDLTSSQPVTPDTFASLSRNTPFENMNLTGRAVYTFLSGILTWNES